MRVANALGTDTALMHVRVQREALNGTQFKVVVADATIRNLKSTQVDADTSGATAA
jgi:hypothetical protein